MGHLLSIGIPMHRNFNPNNYHLPEKLLVVEAEIHEDLQIQLYFLKNPWNLEHFISRLLVV